MTIDQWYYPESMIDACPKSMEVVVKKGQVSAAKTLKAGCGIRFDPEQLGEETGFDFSQAAEFLASAQEEATATSTSSDDAADVASRNKKNPAKSRVKR